MTHFRVLKKRSHCGILILLWRSGAYPFGAINQRPKIFTKSKFSTRKKNNFFYIKLAYCDISLLHINNFNSDSNRIWNHIKRQKTRFASILPVIIDHKFNGLLSLMVPERTIILFFSNFLRSNRNTSQSLLEKQKNWHLFKTLTLINLIFWLVLETLASQPVKTAIFIQFGELTSF